LPRSVWMIAPLRPVTVRRCRSRSPARIAASSADNAASRDEGPSGFWGTLHC